MLLGTTARRTDTGIDLGPLFRTLGQVWSAPGEALGEVILPENLGRNDLEVHPLVLGWLLPGRGCCAQYGRWA